MDLDRDRTTVEREVLAGLLLLLALAIVMVGAAQLPPLLHSGHLVRLSLARSMLLSYHVITGHPGNPILAYPTSARWMVPGTAGWWAGAGYSLVLTVAVAVAAGRGIALLPGWRPRLGTRQRPGRVRQRSWAGAGDLRTLRVDAPTPDRLTVGWLCKWGRRDLLACEPQVNMTVIAPPRAGKTTSAVIPWLLEWPGPAVSLSVKTDVVQATLAARRARGNTWVWDPFGAASAGWNPIAGCHVWEHALLVSDWLASCATQNDRSGVQEFWDREGAKLLAPLLHAAALADPGRAGGPNVARVLAWVDDQDACETDAASILDEHRAGVAARQLRGVLDLDGRQRSSIYQAAGSLMHAYRYPTVQLTAHAEITAERLLDGSASTLYVVAPARDQERLRPLIVAMLSGILDAAVTAANRQGHPVKPRLLLLLDETANIAPLKDLANYLSTCLSAGVVMVTVWQSLAQLHHRYRDDAGTILAASQAKMFLGATTDERTRRYLTDLLGDEAVPTLSEARYRGARPQRQRSEGRTYRPVAGAQQLQQMPEGKGLLLHTNLPPAVITLRPWYRDRGLQQLAGRAAAATRAPAEHATPGQSATDAPA